MFSQKLLTCPYLLLVSRYQCHTSDRLWWGFYISLAWSSLAHIGWSDVSLSRQRIHSQGILSDSDYVCEFNYITMCLNEPACVIFHPILALTSPTRRTLDPKLHARCCRVNIEKVISVGLAIRRYQDLTEFPTKHSKELSDRIQICLRRLGANV